ncbi:MAG: hypothetical protein IKQ31_01660 [Clostridia bacterium]|nr:hypothetical protein [Clostridia bacterium]
MELIINCANNLVYNPTIQYYVTVQNKCGQVLFATYTTSETVRICCCERSVVVCVRLYQNGNIIQTKSRYVNCARENQISMNFDFLARGVQKEESLQQFLVLDKTYNFPIQRASLLFLTL